MRYGGDLGSFLHHRDDPRLKFPLTQKSRRIALEFFTEVECGKHRDERDQSSLIPDSRRYSLLYPDEGESPMGSFSRRTLGKTGLQVSPLGIGGGGGISDADLLYAFDKGINYFFFSADLHHWLYQKSAQALKALCGHGSTVRDQVVLATVTYLSNPEKIVGTLLDVIMELGIDYIDVFHWGWVTDDDNLAPLLTCAHQLQEDNQLTGTLRYYQKVRDLASAQSKESEMELRFRQQQERQEIAQEVNNDLIRRGLVRYVGASFHSRQAARRSLHDLDVLMLRYNIAHTGAEQDIVPFLEGNKEHDPGIVVFNTAHCGGLFFPMPPQGYVRDRYIPSFADCYRFALSNSWVDLVLAGLSNRQQIDMALEALEKGPLSEQECASLRDYGRLFSPENSGTQKKNIESWSWN